MYATKIKTYPFKKTVLYVRKSRADEKLEKAGEDVLQLQTTLMKNSLNDYGIKYNLKKEIGSGDKIKTRPVFQGILKDIENGLYDSIAVREIARLGRGSFTDMGVIYDLIIDYGIYIVTPHKIYDPSNEADLRQIRFEMFLSKEEYEMIKSRMLSAKYTKAKEGRWMATHVPIGYTRDKSTKRLEINEDEAKIVKFIFQLYVNEKLGYKEIHNKLKALGIKFPRTASHNNDYFDDSTIASILENEVYIGTVWYKKTRKDNKGVIHARNKDEQIKEYNQHKKIISVEMFNKAQEIRKDKARLPKNATGMNQFDSSSYQIRELTGLMVCSKCKKTMKMHKKKRSIKSGEIITTVSIICKDYCNAVKYEVGLEYVERLLKYLNSLDEEIIHTYLSEHQMIKEKEEIDLDAHLKELEDTVKDREKDLNEELKRLQEAYLAKAFTLEEFITHKGRINLAIQSLKEVSAKNETSATKESIDREIYTKILDLYNEAKNTEHKNRILSFFFKHIELEVIERGTRSKPAKCKLTPIFMYHTSNELDERIERSKQAI